MISENLSISLRTRVLPAMCFSKAMKCLSVWLFFEKNLLLCLKFIFKLMSLSSNLEICERSRLNYSFCHIAR